MKFDRSPSYADLSLTVLLFAGLAALLLILRKRKKGKNTTAFDLLPGPRQYFLGSYLNLLELADKKKILPVVVDWCAKYGPVIRVEVGPCTRVLLTSPHHLQKLFTSKDLAHMAKPKFVSKVARPVSWVEGLSNECGEKWKSRRKLLNPNFRLQSLKSWTPVFNESGNQLVNSLMKSHSSGAPNPVIETLIDTTLTTVCKALLGTDFDGEGKHSRRKYNTEEFLAGAKRFFEIVSTRLSQPWLAFEPLFNLTSASKELHDIYQMSSKFLIQLVEGTQLQEAGKSSSSSSNKSLLRELIQTGLSNEGIYEESLNLIIAAYDSTGATLHTLLFFLALHPQIQERCQREVDQVFQTIDGDLSAGEDNPGITLTDLKSLQYLEQCLEETLRIVPAFAFALRELEAPLQLDDELELPSGTNILIPLAGIHMNPEVYPEPQRFDPDRMAPERRKERHPYSYMPFAHGPRKCIGAKFATIQILILTSHILKHFTVRTTDKFEDVVWLFNITTQPETPIKFMFEKRE